MFETRADANSVCIAVTDNGAGIARELQPLPALAHTTFVAGFHAHLVKPVNLPDLLRLLAPRRPAPA